MLKIYGSDLSSPSNKVRFTANALNLPYEYIKINLREGENRKKEFLALNPFAKIPVIDDNDFVLFESNAIIKYLASKKNTPLYPWDLQQKALIDQWIDFITMHIGVNLSKVMYNRVFYKFRGDTVDERSITDGLKFLGQYFPTIDAQIYKNTFVVSKEFTLADIVLLATLDPAEVAEIDLSSYQNITRWRNELKKKDFYTKCYKEYGEMLKQPVGAKK